MTYQSNKYNASQMETVLRQAVKEVNKRFDGNINVRSSIKNNVRIQRVTFRLGIFSSKKPGAVIKKVGYTKSGYRHVHAACWHAHGYFFEELLRIDPTAVIVTSFSKIDCYDGNWKDYNIGGRMFPQYASNACNCER